MTIYTYDTEFLEDGSTIDLISIGIVCEDGREYCAVNSDMDKDRIRKDKWLCENVIPHLPLIGKVRTPISNSLDYSWHLDRSDTRVKPKWVIANEVRDFLLAKIIPERPSQTDGMDPIPAHGYPELWAYYGAYDHVALAQLWGKMIHLPKGIPMWTHELKQEMDRIGIDSESVFPQPINNHDALADALWNMLVLREIGIVL